MSLFFRVVWPAFPKSHCSAAPAVSGEWSVNYLSTYLRLNWLYLALNPSHAGGYLGGGERPRDLNAGLRTAGELLNGPCANYVIASSAGWRVQLQEILMATAMGCPRFALALDISNSNI
ncbi:hypothetical protein VTI74DRAFT_1986 [Chaetomium olivicolor]